MPRTINDRKETLDLQYNSSVFFPLISVFCLLLKFVVWQIICLRLMPNHPYRAKPKAGPTEFRLPFQECVLFKKICKKLKTKIYATFKAINLRGPHVTGSFGSRGGGRGGLGNQMLNKNIEKSSNSCHESQFLSCVNVR